MLQLKLSEFFPSSLSTFYYESQEVMLNFRLGLIPYLRAIVSGYFQNCLIFGTPSPNLIFKFWKHSIPSTHLMRKCLRPTRWLFIAIEDILHKKFLHSDLLRPFKELGRFWELGTMEMNTTFPLVDTTMNKKHHIIHICIYNS